MTPAQQPEFIITEELAELIEGQLTNESCKKCPHEGGGVNSGIKAHLRTRPHTPAPDMKEIIEAKRGCLTCLNPDCPIWQAADQNCWKPQQEHDTAIARTATLAENKRVLDAIEKFKTEAWARHDPCDGGFTKFYQSLRVTEESLRRTAQEHP